jgi:hypothetical protein
MAVGKLNFKWTSGLLVGLNSFGILFGVSGWPNKCTFQTDASKTVNRYF